MIPVESFGVLKKAVRARRAWVGRLLLLKVFVERRAVSVIMGNPFGGYGLLIDGFWIDR
jgi:hypothetical protein